MARIVEKWVDFAAGQCAYNALSVKQFLANKNVIVLAHPPSYACSPFCVGRRGESKNSGDPEHSYRK